MRGLAPRAFLIGLLASALLVMVPAPAKAGPVIEGPQLCQKLQVELPPPLLATGAAVAVAGAALAVPVTRAKFKVSSITRGKGSTRNPETGDYEACEVRTITLYPVSANGDPNHENSKFWAASPSGKIEIGCANLEAARHFELDQEFYVDFTPAEG